MSRASINRVVLVGRITQDPELHELPSGQSVCNLRFACNGIRRDADGEYRERPNYFDVAAFGGLAENVARYLHRGSLLAVDGRLEWREWENADRSQETLASGENPRSGQQRRQAVRVVAENIQFLDRRSADGDSAPDGELGEAVESGVDGEPELVGAGAGGLDLMF